jgi:hypothetical protein
MRVKISGNQGAYTGTDTTWQVSEHSPSNKRSVESRSQIYPASHGWSDEAHKGQLVSSEYITIL